MRWKKMQVVICREVGQAVHGVMQRSRSCHGSRLLLSVLQSTAYPLAVVPGWRAELRERLAASR
jgi:hypothetical protein